MTIPEQAVEAAKTALQLRGLHNATVLDARAALEAALPLMGVQRPEDVARAVYGILAENSDPDLVCTFDWDKGARSAIYFKAVRIANAVLALPHTGQPQEGLRIHEMRVTMSSIFQLARDAPPNAKTLKAIREAAERALTRDASKAAPASPRAEGEHERETPVVKPIGQER